MYCFTITGKRTKASTADDDKSYGNPKKNGGKRKTEGRETNGEESHQRKKTRTKEERNDSCS